MKTYWVYILKCNDGSYYTGVTGYLEKRLAQHDAGISEDSYTFERRPLECVYTAQFSEITDAIDYEKQIKRWSRKKKEALIRGEYEKLSSLSARRTAYKKPID